jgi:hypothetical protein
MMSLMPRIVRSADENSAEEEPVGEISETLWTPESAVFDKPVNSDHLHLKALYISGYINGSPMRKMLVDGGAAVNVMPITTYRKLGKTPEEMMRANLTLKDYSGRSQDVRGAAIMEITVGSKTIPTTFFIIDGKGAYTTLLGRDWIHANCCIPSTMHQCLIQWVGNKVEIVRADKSVTIATADFEFAGLESLPCLSGTYWDADAINITDDGVIVTGGSGTPRLL